MKKIITYGVRNYELPTFEKLKEKYDVEFVYRDIYLSNDCKEDAYGYEYVMIRGNCFLNEDSLRALKEHGMKVLLTRTAGYNHIDIAACKKLDIPVCTWIFTKFCCRINSIIRYVFIKKIALYFTKN